MIDITNLADYEDYRNEEHLILFTDPSWCVPCQMFEPHYEEVANRIEFPALRVEIANAEKDLVDEFGVMGVPTLYHVRDGERVPVKGRTVLAVLREVQN